MKLVTSAVRAKDGEGSVTLRPDVPEDLWHAYNLISVGDTLTATTVRKVRRPPSPPAAIVPTDRPSAK